MAVVFLNHAALPALQARVRALKPDSARLWGTMTVERMLSHMTRSIAISLGEVKVVDKSNFFTRTVARRLIFHVLPWPKGKIKASPAFLPEECGTFAGEREALLAAMERFAAAAEAEPGRMQVSDFFGPLPLSYWSRMNGMHLDHHLRQFGV